MTRPCVTMLTNEPTRLYTMRSQLIRALVQDGFDVICIAPEAPGIGEKLASLGARFQPVQLDRKSLSVFDFLRFIGAVRRLYRELRPQVALHYSPKGNVYGNLATIGLGVPVMNTVTGLGFVFTPTDRDPFWKGALQAFASFLYMIAFRLSHRVFFQNRDDLEFFVSRGLVRRQAAKLVAGSGIETEVWKPASAEERSAARQAYQIPSEAVVVTLPARMLVDKGIREFTAAARRLRDRFGGQAWFVLVGGLDPGNPAHVSEEELNALTKDSGCHWLRHANDMRTIYALSDVVVLPSYREGMPRVVLEASSMGLPVITTDTVGCRESILPEKTGFLVPVRAVDELAEAMARLVDSKELRETFGCAGRAFMQEHFEVSRVVDAMTGELRGVLAG